MFFPTHAVPMGLSGPMNNAKSSSSTGGVTGHDVANHSPLISHHQWHRVPVWAYVLISIAAFVILLFVAAFIYHGIQERRLARNQNRRLSIRTVAVKAVKAALFFWVFALIGRCLCGRRGKTPSGGAVSSYRKVDNAGEMTANNNLYSASLGYGNAPAGSSGAAYGDGGSGNLDSISEKYEPYTGIGTKAVAAGATADYGHSRNNSRSHSRSASTSVPYSPGSAFAFQQDTSYAPTDVASIAPGPRHITPAVSPVPSPLPTPAAVTEPLMAHASSTYVPTRDSHPMY
ncbi:hypothetical protein SBRCBS47491_002573 [Sporothrix bragantina]|uniref:Integral membrane protein n=1 Tax=Sporothrix bragantina TaxID=671064 RepID=A0ABP0B861_9PEZI